ncbi:hypothetical protein PFISCL1PPCAC_18683 [Pristionchus fissidentatus]|uniref:Uncharacterized protein n=1 Tax=Pristionchus fissidentatus TaxID=1538716 RepID=A0AAV5W6D2_9BILA|nr:hypothetical protein PFISCL1PPCAC_18683 [Pristionchus fissidentatus]
MQNGILPIARHTIALRAQLHVRGLKCYECSYTLPIGLPERRRFHRDLMCVCVHTNCSDLYAMSSDAVYDLKWDTRRARQPDGSGRVKLMRRCIFCSTKSNVAHKDHRFAPITSIGALARTLEAGEDLKLIEERWRDLNNPFHLSMPSPECIDKLLSSYFACCGGEVQ